LSTHVSSLSISSAPRDSQSITAAERAILRRIRQNGINLVLWERSLPGPVAALCRRLVAPRLPLELDVTAAPGSTLIAAFASRPTFHDAVRNAALHWLIEDIADLAADFAVLADCSEVRVRLTKVADDGCAAFHVDTLPVRLLCTYAGRGTQWADEPDVRRAELGLRNRTTAEANAAIVPDATRIRTMRTGAVAVFKGRLWPGANGSGLVHRSHPVCCGEHARLRLAIDPAGYGY